MVESLKKLDKKFLILVGIVILLPILLIVFLAIIQGCSNKKTTYTKYEEKMISASEKYFKKEKQLLKEESKVDIVSLDKLVELGYIKSPKKMLGDESCSGTVSVRLNGSVIEANDGGFYNYIANLKCKKYETKSLKKMMMEDLTTEKSGLYLQDNFYVYKGDEVNNYITFYGKNYRILGIDSNGLVKLLKSESEPLDRYWDIKYNTDVNDSYGKNIYEDSSMLKLLIGDYNNTKKISKNAKSHVVSNNICVGKRDINDISKSNESECSVLLEDQVISLIGITDFVNASLDNECTSITSKSCRNYNYLKELGLESWTSVPVSNNSYDVYYLHGGIIAHEIASKYISYNLLIYIDGNEIVVSGDGSKSSPYVIK